jgi:hypothetical protein
LKIADFMVNKTRRRQSSVPGSGPAQGPQAGDLTNRSWAEVENLRKILSFVRKRLIHPRRTGKWRPVNQRLNASGPGKKPESDINPVVTI